MQTKLEKCGNLAVPVDESGTATGRATYTPTCPYCGRPFETVNTAMELLAALERIVPWMVRLSEDVGALPIKVHKDMQSSLERAKAAIAKAKGTAL